MSMSTPAPTPRARLFSDAWWEQWRQVRSMAVSRGNKRQVRRLDTAAAVGMTCYITGEVAYAIGEKASEAGRFVRYSISVIGV